MSGQIKKGETGCKCENVLYISNPHQYFFVHV